MRKQTPINIKWLVLITDPVKVSWHRNSYLSCCRPQLVFLFCITSNYIEVHHSDLDTRKLPPVVAPVDQLQGSHWPRPPRAAPSRWLSKLRLSKANPTCTFWNGPSLLQASPSVWLRLSQYDIPSEAWLFILLPLLFSWTSDSLCGLEGSFHPLFLLPFIIHRHFYQ